MYKLLIVDDEKWLKERLAKTIHWESFQISQVATASDGQEAYDYILAHRPHIVITDVRMPILSGLELIRQVRRQELDTHFIIISGYADFNYARQAIQMQVVDYITKPVQDEELIQCVLNCEADIESKARRVRELEELKEQCAIEKGSKDADLSHSMGRKQTRTMKNILEFIDRNYMLPITSSSVAEEFYFNPSYFSGMFKDHVGIPFTKYLVNLRMDESKRLLRTTNIKITSIARSVGYEDIQYFMKIFKANTGTTPNAYRDLFS